MHYRVPLWELVHQLLEDLPRWRLAAIASLTYPAKFATCPSRSMTDCMSRIARSTFSP